MGSSLHSLFRVKLFSQILLLLIIMKSVGFPTQQKIVLLGFGVNLRVYLCESQLFFPTQ